MALSKRAKVGIAVASGAVVMLGVGIAMASGKRQGSAPPELPEHDDDVPPSPSTVTTQPPEVDMSHQDDEHDEEHPTDLGIDLSHPPPLVNTSTTPLDLPTVLQTAAQQVPTVLQHPEQLPTVLQQAAQQVPTVVQQTTPVQVQPPSSPVSFPTAADALTQQMVSELLAAEHSTGWKRIYPIVQEWQRTHGRTVDGKFGPGDALYLATLLGTIPIVRYWPAKDGTHPKAALADYRSGLMTIAASKPHDWMTALQVSANRETGQSFGPPVGTGGKGVIV